MSEIENLLSQVGKIEGAAKTEQVRTVAIGFKPVIQINTFPLLDGTGQIIKEGKSFFCETKEQEIIFKENNPGVETESYNIELLVSTANKKLGAVSNREQFTRKF